MIEKLKLLFTKTIKRQLILTTIITFVVLMSIFIFNLINNQKDFLHNQSLSRTISLTNTLAKSSTSWVLSNDFIGMEEIIDSIVEYPNLEYAMILSPNGKVLANTKKQYVNQYVSDKISQKILTNKIEITILVNNTDIIDIAVPIVRGFQHIGWARIALNQAENINNINDVLNQGILYIFIAIFIGAIFSYILAIGLTKGLYNLINIAKQTTSGTKHLRADFNRSDELGTLAFHINTMLDKIEIDEQKLSTINDSLEQKVQEKTKILAQINKELEESEQELQVLNENLEQKINDEVEKKYQ